jgi:uroporphyrin-III C-methyltransferase
MKERGVLVVGHGSRRSEANDDVRLAAARIGRRGNFPLVEAAFLEIAAPSIDEGFARLAARGAESVVVHPYFLSPGRHTRGDIPVAVREAAARHPNLEWTISEPLSAHELVIEASVERIREAERGGGRDDANRALRGKVYLVGAGPGDPELLTLKARRLLATCDAVIYDSLVSREILELCAPHAEVEYAGKIGGGRQTPQIEINRRLAERALRGESVVRLKGGDPFLFGRGGEEALALHAVGVPFEVVPGVSSALAAPAYAGIPVTHRGASASLAVVTATDLTGGYARAGLAALAAAETLVVLMGATRLHDITRDVRAAGRSGETPVAVIRWGTRDAQQTVVGTLETIARDAERAGMRSPAVIVIGEVVRLRENLRWFEEAPADSLAQERASAPTPAESAVAVAV